MDSVFVAFLSVFGTLVAIVIVLLLLSAGNSGQLAMGLRFFVKVLRNQEFATKVAALMGPVEIKAAAPTKPSGAPLRLLALLQREGRLLDFLMEDVQAYKDEDIGHAVRDIHQKCQAALKEHLVLEPVIAQAEESAVEVPAGFDPSAIRLVGNVTGQPPFRGTLKHQGWRVKDLKLTPPPEGQDEFVLMPAEVEL